MLAKLDLNQRWLTDTELFVREPVDEICKRIKKDSNKIILSGRGSGKTIILNYLESTSLSTPNKFISMRFDSCGINGLFSSDEEIEKLKITYYEVLFSSQLLTYIKHYYKLTYDKHFEKLHNSITSLSQDFVRYINNYMYTKEKFSKNVDTGLYASEIIESMKKILDIDTLSLGIDRFDWINNSSPEVQKILSEYFCIFDKVVITSDDKEITRKVPSGYKHIKSFYNEDKNIIKEIINRRIENYNSNTQDSKVDSSIITDDMYEKLIERTNGNIKTMLYIISSLIDEVCWDYDYNVDEVFDRKCKEKEIEEQKMKQLGGVSHFHL